MHIIAFDGTIAKDKGDSVVFITAYHRFYSAITNTLRIADNSLFLNFSNGRRPVIRRFHRRHHDTIVVATLLLVLLRLTLPVRAMTADQMLNAVPAPNFKPGNTLPRLTQATWDLDYNTCVALANQWGYCLIFQGAASDLANPSSLASQLCALSAANPRQYPLSVYVPQPFQDDNFLSTLPESAWTHEPDGTRVTGLLSPLCPDSAYQAAGTIVSTTLSRRSSSMPRSISFSTPGKKG